MLDARTISRRSFMRRMLGAGVGLLSLEFVGATLAMLWPGLGEGLGVEYRVGTLPRSTRSSRPGRAARRWSSDPPAPSSSTSRRPRRWRSARRPRSPNPAASELLALWRKCPHLGCMIPPACEGIDRFQCYCHQSTYNILGEKLELGPAPRGMDRFPVRIDKEGVVIIDTRELIEGPPKNAVTFRDPHPPDVGCL